MSDRKSTSPSLAFGQRLQDIEASVRRIETRVTWSGRRALSTSDPGTLINVPAGTISNPWLVAQLGGTIIGPISLAPGSWSITVQLLMVDQPQWTPPWSAGFRALMAVWNQTANINVTERIFYVSSDDANLGVPQQQDIESFVTLTERSNIRVIAEGYAPNNAGYAGLRLAPLLFRAIPV